MLLDIRKLVVKFHQHGRTVHAVNQLDLQVASNEILAVVGESGAGKSQAFLALTQLLAPNAEVAGSAWFEGRDLLAMDDVGLQTVRGARIAYVFQDAMAALNPYLTIRKQLLEVIGRHQGIDGATADQAALEMLANVQLDEADTAYRAYPHQLSGGQRQRVMLAMALLGKPDLLIADEPTTALDVTVQQKIIDLLKRLQAERGFSLVFITHDLGVVARIAQRVAVMYAGNVVEVGTVREIFQQAAHPYTQGLLAAAPRLDGGLPRPIPGQPPKLEHLPEGCPFAPRCERTTNQCQRRVPAVALSDTHTAWCHRVNSHG